MIKLYNNLGTIRMSADFFQGLVSTAAQSCYGVAGMAVADKKDTLKSVVFGNNFYDKGVRVYEENGKLNIELHILVIYGLNISAIVKSITHKVRYIIEDSTGLKTGKVNVIIEDIINS